MAMFTLRGYPRHSILASEASLARTRERGAARSRVLARLVSLAQIRELACRLIVQSEYSQKVQSNLALSIRLIINTDSSL